MARTCKHGQQFVCIDCRNDGHPMPNIPARPHYHVLVGMGGGYLPYETATFPVRRDAESYAHTLVTERRHDRDTPEVWYGSAREGYVRKSRDVYDLGEYIHVAACTDDECGSAGDW